MMYNIFSHSSHQPIRGKEVMGMFVALFLLLVVLAVIAIFYDERNERSYDYVGAFYEELAITKKGEEWFHTNPDGSRAYEKSFDWVGRFSNGLAPAKKGGEKFHIDRSGIRAYEESYDWVGSFAGEMAWVKKDKRWLCIDRNGSCVS